MTAAQERLEAARNAYNAATSAYWNQRDDGGIVPLDPAVPKDSDDLAAGAKFKATTPTATKVLGVWQVCKAALDHAAADLRRERGDKACATCPKPKGYVAPARATEDLRLPPEHDEEASP